MNRDPWFPDDENGFVLRNMLKDGDDLTISRDIEFFFLFDTQNNAEAFALQLSGDRDLSLALNPCEELWQVEVTKHMLPSHAGISDLEATLILMAKPLGGKPDGWGCFKQPVIRH